ncbi:MAG: hypothetical protein JMDDDDMK_04975 [Acidobacteria bacterium]|nr:hypothetical protein [Acidobacteriota bacterium]
MNNVQDAFKHNRARKNVILGGAAILICITILSCVSSFIIYRGGFTDVAHPFDKLLALFAVIVVEGAFVWLVYGFTRAFSSASERLISVCGMSFLLLVMLMNLVTHFMMVKGIELGPFQQAWIQWGAVMVFIAVLLIVLFITLADPVIKLVRLELRYLGKQQETILEAKTEGLDSERVREAMAARAEHEADLLATKIVRDGRSLPAAGASAYHRQYIGFPTDAADDLEDEYNGPKGRRR